jgi:hypothetical protein
MPEDRSGVDPLDDEDQPIPGTSRARVAMAAGLILVVGIVLFLVWFIASNSERARPGSILG